MAAKKKLVRRTTTKTETTVSVVKAKPKTWKLAVPGWGGSQRVRPLLTATRRKTVVITVCANNQPHGTLLLLTVPAKDALGFALGLKRTALRALGLSDE